MLWYKAWLETRSRFWCSLGGMLAICSYFVFHSDRLCMPYCRTEWYYSTLHTAHSFVCFLWIPAVTLLMMGGLVREKAVGASAFTLALPVSRMSLMRVRILTGLLQAMALAILPWAAMFLIASAIGKASASQAFFHLVLLASGGLVFFAVALLVSSLVEGEYTAPAVTFGILVGAAIELGDKPLNAWSPWNFVLGTEYFDRKTALFTGSIPWLHVIAAVMLSATLSVISIKVIQKREF
jgi:hypothetical protein